MSEKIPKDTIHGGAGAYKAIQLGKEFSGLGLIAQRSMEKRLAEEGADGELVRNVGRLQVVVDLYGDAVIKALQDGNEDKATALIKVWGWMQNSAIRGWDLVRKLKRPDDMAEANRVIEQYRRELEEAEGDHPSDS